MTEDVGTSPRDRLAERLFANVSPEPTSGCWIWCGSTNRSRGEGYGILKIGRKSYRAHRVAFEVFRCIEIPAGYEVMHKCDVTACINPDHLSLGTHTDNMRDRSRKNRCNAPSGLRNGAHTKPHKVLKGSQHGCAKLNEMQVRAIRASKQSQRELARQFGVSQATVFDIKSGRKWSHV